MRRWAVPLAILLATAVLALGGAAALWGRPGWLLTPWQRALAPSEAAHDAVRALRERAAHLEAENGLLRERLRQYAAIAGETGQPPERTVVARGTVVGRTARSGRRFLELDVGAGAGVVRDMPVCDGWSLAGLVSGVREGRSLVQELGDAELRIPVAILLAGRPVAEGVLAGDGAAGEARIDFVEPRDDLRIDPGMGVVSAASDGRLPPGIVVGAVHTATRGGPSEHWRIRVRLAAAPAAASLLVLRAPPTPESPPDPVPEP
jgi:cell shape-determining protein MreC